MKTTKAQKDSKEKPAEPVSQQAAPPGESVDRIRDIIFGAQMRDYEARFNSLEERLTQNLNQLREQTENRLQKLAAKLETELESEIGERKTNLKQLGQRLKEAEGGLLEKIDNQGTHTKTELSRLQEHLSGKTDETAGQLRQEIESLSRQTEQRLRQLTHDKTDRAALAALLADVADRLSSDGNAKKK